MEVGFLMISFNASFFQSCALGILEGLHGSTFNTCEFASVDWCASWHKWKARPSKRPTSCVPDESEIHPSVQPQHVAKSKEFISILGE